jgi:hypothetical protein
MGKLEAALLELKENNSKLAEAKVEGDFDVRAVKRAKSNRENVTKQVAALIDKIKVQDKPDFKTLEEFYDAAVQNLETCLENMDRSFKYTRPVFPQESKDLSESLSRLSRAFKELRGAILENKSEIEAIDPVDFEQLLVLRAGGLGERILGHVEAVGLATGNHQQRLVDEFDLVGGIPTHQVQQAAHCVLERRDGVRAGWCWGRS